MLAANCQDTVRKKKVGANLAPRFLFGLSCYLIALVPVQADTRNPAIVNVEILLQLEQMQQEIRELRNLTETQAHKLEQIQEEQRKRYLDLDQRAQEHSQRLTQLEEAPIRTAPTPTASRPSSTTAAVSAKTAATTGISAQQAYNKAYANIPEQRFSQAISEFQEFIKHYPDSQLIGNAYYWLGEIYMAQNRTAEAEKMFNVVVSNYPESFKIADSKYKLGQVQMRYGNEAKAKEIMQEIIASHPREPAADLARSFLRTAN